MRSCLSHTDQAGIPCDVKINWNSSTPGWIKSTVKSTAVKSTGATDFLFLCHTNYRSQRAGDGPPQREMDAFLEQWISVDEEVEDLLGFSLFSSVFLVLIRFSLCKHWILFPSSQTLSSVCVSLSFFIFLPNPWSKNTSNKPRCFCLYSPWISQQCCSWVRSTGSALSRGPARTHHPYWSCPRKALPVVRKWKGSANGADNESRRRQVTGMEKLPWGRNNWSATTGSFF